MNMAKLDIECCPICCAPVKAIETCNSVRFEYDGPRWISVEERLPEDYEDVVLIMRNGANSSHRVAYREHGGWSFGGGRRVTDEVTHWMHLPEPPKEAP
jgi:hypothetical protein